MKRRKNQDQTHVVQSSSDDDDEEDLGGVQESQLNEEDDDEEMLTVGQTFRPRKGNGSVTKSSKRKKTSGKSSSTAKQIFPSHSSMGNKKQKTQNGAFQGVSVKNLLDVNNVNNVAPNDPIQQMMLQMQMMQQAMMNQGMTDHNQNG